MTDPVTRAVADAVGRVNDGIASATGGYRSHLDDTAQRLTSAATAHVEHDQHAAADLEAAGETATALAAGTAAGSRDKQTRDRPGDLVAIIVAALRAARPAGARSAYLVRAVHTHLEHEFRFTDAAGTDERREPPDELGPVATELRAAMFEDTTGTWFEAEVELSADDRVSTAFGYDAEPAWTIPAPPSWYVDDLGHYPRPVETLPAWLVERIAQSVGG
jgi:hypothetical protein